MATVCFLFFKGVATGVNSQAADAAIAFNQRIMGGTLGSNLAGEFSLHVRADASRCASSARSRASLRDRPS